jgi:hypothetical protein
LFATGFYKRSFRGEREAFRVIAERDESAVKPSPSPS